MGFVKKGWLGQPRMRIAPPWDDQSQVLESSSFPNEYVKFVERLTVSLPTGLNLVMSVAMSFGVILLFLLCLLVNQCSRHLPTAH